MLNGGGSGGNDTLDGGLGKDTLTGGRGDDHFKFSEAPGAKNADLIKDFVSADDQIELVDDFYDAIGPTLSAKEFQVKAGHVAGTNKVRIMYDTKDGSIWYDEDGARTDHATVKIATLDGIPTLKFGDFDLV